MQKSSHFQQKKAFRNMQNPKGRGTLFCEYFFERFISHAIAYSKEELKLHVISNFQNFSSSPSGFTDPQTWAVGPS